tara:strand:+ start:121 stop:375 length:255 start_codon:yes stop_codon:yes gene_type:complete
MKYTEKDLTKLIEHVNDLNENIGLSHDTYREVMTAIKKEQIKLKKLVITDVGINAVAFCGCIDRCSSKRQEFYCRAKRSCVHKV